MDSLGRSSQSDPLQRALLPSLSKSPRDATVRTWDTKSGRNLRLLEGHRAKAKQGDVGGEQEVGVQSLAERLLSSSLQAAKTRSRLR